MTIKARPSTISWNRVLVPSFRKGKEVSISFLPLLAALTQDFPQPSIYSHMGIPFSWFADGAQGWRFQRKGYRGILEQYGRQLGVSRLRRFNSWLRGWRRQWWSSPCVLRILRVLHHPVGIELLLALWSVFELPLLNFRELSMYIRQKGQQLELSTPWTSCNVLDMNQQIGIHTQPDSSTRIEDHPTRTYKPPKNSTRTSAYSIWYLRGPGSRLPRMPCDRERADRSIPSASQVSRLS